MNGVRASMLTVAVTVALLGLSHVASDTSPAKAAEQTTFTSAATATDGPATPRQDATTDDELLSVQMWTLFAAGGAAALGLLLFLLRMALGWVEPPPPQDDAAH